jgi:hypothetical protein
VNRTYRSAIPVTRVTTTIIAFRLDPPSIILKCGCLSYPATATGWIGFGIGSLGSQVSIGSPVAATGRPLRSQEHARTTQWRAKGKSPRRRSKCQGKAKGCITEVHVDGRFGRPGAGKTTAAEQALQSIRTMGQTSSSHYSWCAIDLDVSVNLNG